MPQDWKGTGASEGSEPHLSSASSQLPGRLRVARERFSQPGPSALSSQPVRFLYQHVAQTWQSPCRPRDHEGWTLWTTCRKDSPVLCPEQDACKGLAGSAKGTEVKSTVRRRDKGTDAIQCDLKKRWNIFCAPEFVAGINAHYTCTHTHPELRKTPDRHINPPCTLRLLPDTTHISRKRHT